MYKYDSPFHSDFLIHWTGKDIEKRFHTTKWTENHSSIICEAAGKAYLERLKYILKYGLWLTKDDNEKILRINGEEIVTPNPPRVCFTELKLSDVRSHAAQYGRLGIGFKRFYVFDRLGGPMHYYQDKVKYTWFINSIFSKSKRFKKDDYYSCFLKGMAERSKTDDQTLDYKYFDEAEWRIIYSK